MTIRTPPWLMWGNQITSTLDRVGGAGTVPASGQPAQTTQLARVSYGRPENWSFLLGYRVTNTDLVGAPCVLQVSFDLTIGVGRTNTTLQNFGFFQFNNPSATSPVQYATKVFTPRQVATDATTVSECETFPAQDIQCQARILVSGITGGTTITVDTFAYFSPKSHIRPEWYAHERSHIEQFRAGEEKGT